MPCEREKHSQLRRKREKILHQAPACSAKRGPKRATKPATYRSMLRRLSVLRLSVLRPLFLHTPPKKNSPNASTSPSGARTPTHVRLEICLPTPPLSSRARLGSHRAVRRAPRSAAFSSASQGGFYNLDGKVAVVCGAGNPPEEGNGIGAMTSLVLARQGCKVVSVSNVDINSQTITDQIKAEGGTAHTPVTSATRNRLGICFPR